VILAPFVVWGAPIENWTERFVQSAGRLRIWAALILGLLLVLDILLPVPSSVVSTAAGALFGWGGGCLVSWVGMMASCGIGYALGTSAGRVLARPLVGEKELRRLAGATERWGAGVVILFRAVPVLAEASVLFAGMSRMSRRQFLFLCALSNAGISLVYAGLGAYAASANSFLLAFAGALLLPGIALSLWRLKETGSRGPV
jgi:uncharacterized membrane protein YdjX (TVP38/TMEM64 family)